LVKEADHRHYRLLRTRRERPSNGCAAAKKMERPISRGAPASHKFEN
jgi:hypothetical protein